MANTNNEPDRTALATIPAAPRHAAVACWMCPCCRALYDSKAMADRCADYHQIATSMYAASYGRNDKYPVTVSVVMSDGTVVPYRRG